MVAVWRANERTSLQTHHCIQVGDTIYKGSVCQLGTIDNLFRQKLNEGFEENDVIKNFYIADTNVAVLDQKYVKRKSNWPYSESYYDFVDELHKAGSKDSFAEFVHKFKTRSPFQCIACVLHSSFGQLEPKAFGEHLRNMKFGDHDVKKLTTVLKRSYNVQLGGSVAKRSRLL